MANNKWLNDLKTLKSTTNILRDTLRNKNVPAYNTDTLSSLVSKVPVLAPIALSDEDKWQPDPLWKFPDPNGSGEMKTIRQIYDEDAMASSYKFRAIYQIEDDYDTIDLKATMNARTNADTFILSDGTTYTNITSTTLNHTWDKSKDIVDSKGRKMRYVRVYTDTKYTYALGFNRSSIWGVHKLTDNSVIDFGASNFATEWALYYGKIECIEIESIGTSSWSGIALPFSLQKLVVNTPCNITTAMGIPKNLKELIMTNLKGIETTSNFLDLTSPIKVLNITNPEKYTSTKFILTSSSSAQFKEIVGLENLTTVTTLNIQNQYMLKTFMLPPNTTSITLSYLYSMKNLIVPDGCTTVNVSYCYYLQELTIPQSTTTLTLNGLNDLRVLNVPIDFNIAINIASSAYMSHESLVDILNNLKDLTGETSKKLTLGTRNLAKLSDEEKLIATNKNWTLA